jgi:ACR3 family arsenite transporter
MGVFKRYLTLWAIACIASGILAGEFLARAMHALGRLTIAQVTLPVAALI